MSLSQYAVIREVGPRDGFQSVEKFIPIEEKARLIGLISDAGVQEIEATSFVSPKAIPQLKDARELVMRLPRKGARYSALVPNFLGAKNAIDAGIDELVVFISASESHNARNVRRTITESMADLDDIFELAKDRGTPVVGAVAVSFGCPFEGDVSEENVFRIVEGYVSRGAAGVILADTTGMATPRRVDGMVTAFAEKFKDIRLILHFHNNRGTAMANLYAALLAGAFMFDCALGGIGGCPYVPQAAGNLPTEDVVYMLEDMGITTGISVEKIIEAARRLEEILGYSLPGQVLKSGQRDPDAAKRIWGDKASMLSC